MRSAGFALRIAACALPLLSAACAAPTRGSPATPGDVRVERVDKAFDLERGVARVAIDNPWGEINVRNRDEREVGIHAVIQRMPPQFARAVLRPHREGDTLRVEVAFDGTAKAPRPGRIDLAVYLPADLALVLRTRGDRISAKKRTGAIEATTDSGAIFVSTRSRLSLRTQSGRVRANALGASWPGDSLIQSDSGRLIVGVPTFGDIVVDAETGGRLGTNFGLSVHAGADGRSSARARYGQGTSPLRVRSRTGEVALEQLIRMGDDSLGPDDDD